MKTFCLLLLLSVSSLSFGQKCKCTDNPQLSEIISCEKIRFDNKAMLYWSFNCDSSWLTFTSPIKKSTILFSLGDGLQELTGRLGYSYQTEYKNTFLIENRVISGCCSPPEYFLFDKNTGKMKQQLGCLLYYGTDKSKPFTIGINNSNYDTTSSNDYNALVIYNTDKGTTNYITFPKNEINNLLKREGLQNPEELFEEPIVNGQIIQLKYRIRGKKATTFKTITIDLKRY